MIYFIYLITFILIQLIYFRIADKLNIIDKPNERSSHSTVTIRGGGFIFYVAVLFFFIFSHFQYPWFLGGLTLISLISFADDVQPQTYKFRLFIHFISMLLLFYQWNLFSFPWYYTAVSLVLCIGIINAYNFMDGINGITGGYSLVVIASLWYINNYQILFVDNRLLYLVALSLISFNLFNFRKKAKCFAGDVGAISIAFIIIFITGLLIFKTGEISFIVLLVVYGVDTVLTIIHRIILKENIFDAHRKHLYQLMANEMKMPQLSVSLIYSGIQVLILCGFYLINIDKKLYVFLVVIFLSAIYYVLKKKYFHLHTIENRTSTSD